jgi:glyoxylase-like metal-dependent hydrolase (beta-lactamase superfamily II)
MGRLKVNHYVVGMVQTNCYVVFNEITKECVVIDPGASGKSLAEKLRQEGLTPVAILLTHGHFDHVSAAKTVAKEFDIKIYAHEAEAETLHDSKKNASWMMGASENYDADVFVSDGEVLNLAGFDIKVLHTPGHTEGGCCYYIAEETVIFTGDTLFAQSVGRTDLPGGSMSQIVRSIQEKILTLTEAGNADTDVTVYPGHNDITTIETERKYNPYL